MGIAVGFEEVKDYLYGYPFLASNPYYKNLKNLTEFQELLRLEKKKYEDRKEKYAGL
jgi:hypothetical protein